MSQKSIFITGAASGIGRETALIFAAAGWRVGLCDLDRKKLEAVATEAGGTTSIHPADVVDAEALGNAIAGFCGGADKPLDALFNCAGILEMRRFDETPLERLHALVDVNIKGVINGIYKALPNLRSASEPRIVTMGSVSGIYGVPELAVYSSSKFAVRGLTEATNIELGAQGIWVCDIMVSYVRTPMVVSARHQAQSVGILGVNVEPRQVAETAFAAVTGEKKIHWFVTPDDEAVARDIDATPWEERHKIFREISGF